MGDITIDLSHIWYIASMNSIPKDTALADRWWVIQVDGYTLKDKIKIVREYLLPKALANFGMNKEDIVLGEDTCRKLVERVCKENDKGVRTIQKTIEDLVTKINFLLAHQTKKGGLPFRTTFKLKHKLKLPVKLTPEILNKLINSKKLNPLFSTLYL